MAGAPRNLTALRQVGDIRGDGQRRSKASQQRNRRRRQNMKVKGSNSHRSASICRRPRRPPEQLRHPARISFGDRELERRKGVESSTFNSETSPVRVGAAPAFVAQRRGGERGGTRCARLWCASSSRRGGTRHVCRSSTGESSARECVVHQRGSSGKRVAASGPGISVTRESSPYAWRTRPSGCLSLRRQAVIEVPRE